MTTSNDWISSQRIHRFLDVVDEPNKMLMPISGYENMELVSLEKAVEPLVHLLPAVQSYVYVAKQRCSMPIPDGLTVDESSAIMLYSMQWEPEHECLFYAFNKVLRTENRAILKPWFLYLKLILTGLFRLPSAPCHVYRSVKQDLHTDYMKGKTIIWWGFSSCTRSIDVLQTEQFHGTKGLRTLFVIECINGKDISRHSYFPNEKEVLILPATSLQVVASLDQGNGLYMIQLRETQSPVPLLGPAKTVSHSNKSHSEPIEKHLLHVQNTLPSVVDLRLYVRAVKNQLQTNSNVANVVASNYEILLKKNTGKHLDISRLFIYYNSRLIDGLNKYNMSDVGSTLKSAMEALTHYGCCKETLYPYNLEYVNQTPPQYCYSEAKKYRVKGTRCIENNLNEMKHQLADGYPFVFGLRLFPSFMQAGSNNGHVLIPQYYEQSTGEHPWHAMLAVGYSDPSQCFIVQNSWGSDWGDKGYCYIPYEYMCNSQYCRDLHSITEI